MEAPPPGAGAARSAGGQLGETGDWAADAPFGGRALEISRHNGPVKPCAWHLPPASLRFFYPVPSVILLGKRAIPIGVR